MSKSADASAPNSHHIEINEAVKHNVESHVTKLHDELYAEKKKAPAANASEHNSGKLQNSEKHTDANHKDHSEHLAFNIPSIYHSNQKKEASLSDPHHTQKNTADKSPEDKRLKDSVLQPNNDHSAKVHSSGNPGANKQTAAPAPDKKKDEPAKAESSKSERPSDELIRTTAKTLRDDLRSDKWIIDPRGGDAHKVEQTLSSIPHDKETMERLQQSFSSDKDHPNQNLLNVIDSRLSKDDADRIKATVEHPESTLARLDTVQSRLTENEAKKSILEKIKPVTNSTALFLPVISLVGSYQESETEKHLTAGRRELKDQLSVMNSKDIEAANRESLAKNGKSLEQHLLETPGLREEDKQVLKVLLKGSDQRAKDPSLNAQMAAEAIRTKDIDLLRESLGTKESREAFNKSGNQDLLSTAFSGNDLKVAKDLARSGRLDISTQVGFSRGLLGTSKEDVAQAVKTMSDDERSSLRRGQELANKDNCAADCSDQDKLDLASFQKFRQALKENFNPREAGAIEAQAIYGEGNLISKIAQTHSDGFLGLGAGHDKNKVYDLVDRQLTREDYDRLKNDKDFRRELDTNLKGFLKQDEFERVTEIIDRKIEASSYDESKSRGRSTLERLQDLHDGDIDSKKKGAAISDILEMTAADRDQYKNDKDYRAKINHQVEETFASGDGSIKIAQRLLQESLTGKEPALTALEKVQVGGLKGDSLPKTIDNIETFIQSEPSIVNRLKHPVNEDDKQMKQTLDKELRRAVYDSGEVVTFESGQDNFDTIYRPLAQKLLESGGKVDIAEKLSHISRDMEAYQTLSTVGPEEKAALLNSHPQSESDKNLQKEVFGRFSSPQERHLAEEVLASGQFSQLSQLRAASISRQSLSAEEIDTVKEILGRVKPEEKSALNEAYSKNYNANLTEILKKLPKEEQASVESMLHTSTQSRAEQIELLAKDRIDSESGLLGNINFGKRYTAVQNADTFRQAQEAASAKFQSLPLERQQQLFANASESYRKWQEEKSEKANQITDGVIIGVSILASGGTSIPVALGAAAAGGTVKVVGNKALIGDNYGNVEEVATDFSKGSISTLVNNIGPAQAASVLKIGGNISRETTASVVAKVGQESLSSGGKKLLIEGGEQILEQGLRHAVQESIITGSDTVSNHALKELAGRVATDGNEKFVEKALANSLAASSEALAKRTILQRVATEQGLHAGSAFVAGSTSGTVEGLANWDPALSPEENIKRTAKSAADTGITSAITAAGITQLLHTGHLALGKLSENAKIDHTIKAPEIEGHAFAQESQPTLLSSIEMPTRMTGLPEGKSNYILSDGSENHLVTKDGKVKISQSEIIIGRDASSDLVVPESSKTVSRRHAAIKMKGDLAFIEDLNSANHTFVNGQKIEREVMLKSGDKVKLGDSYEFTFGNEKPSPLVVLDFNGKQIIQDRPAIRLGRAAGQNDVELADAAVSGKHATIRQEGGRYFLKDEGSTNGTYVNGQKERISGEVEIKPGDKIRIGGAKNEFTFSTKAPELRAKLKVGDRELSFEGRQVVLGRDSGRADLVFPDMHTSGKHAILREANGRFYLQDAGSANGTWVNGVKINKEIQLSPGVRIQLGKDTAPIIFSLERKPLSELGQQGGRQSLELLRKSPVALPEVSGGISPRAVEQSDHYGKAYEISERLEDGWSIAGAGSTFTSDGKFSSNQRRPAIVIDRQNDPVLKAAIEEAQEKFKNLPPKELAKTLTQWSRDLLKPASLSEAELDKWYSRFNNSNHGKRIYLGELIRQGKGVCSQQAILLKVLSDEFPQLQGKVKLIRGNAANSPEGVVNHAWTEVDFGDGKPLIYDPRHQIYGKSYENHGHTPGRDLIARAISEKKAYELKNAAIEIGGRNFEGLQGGKYLARLKRSGQPDENIFLQENDNPYSMDRTRKEIAASKLTHDLFGLFPATVERTLSVDGQLKPFRVQEGAGKALQAQWQQSINYCPLNDLAQKLYGDDSNASIVKLLNDDKSIYKAWEKATVERSIFGDTDFHPANLTYENVGGKHKISNIDLEGGFRDHSAPYWPDNGPIGFHRRAFAAFADRPLSPDVKAKVDRFVAKYDSREGLERLQETGLTEKEARYVVSRAKWFSTHGTLPPLKAGF